MTNQSHGCDMYGCGDFSPTPNWSISLWYWNSEYSGARTGLLTPFCCAQSLS